MNSQLVFQYPFWFIVICILAGIFYSWLLYNSKSTFTRVQKRMLALLRGLLVSTLCFLLFNPLLRSQNTEILKPVLLVGVDNSGSVKVDSKNVESISNSIDLIKSKLNDSGFEIKFRDFNGEDITKVENSFFSGKKTDFGSFFQLINEEFDGQNLTDVLLISDGIANSGFSPLNQNLPYLISSLGVGDTTRKKDAAIKGITANKLAFLGNDFPVIVDVSAFLVQNKSTTILIKNNDQVIDKKVISFEKDQEYKSISFQIAAKVPGKQRYTIELAPISGEFSVKNNFADLIIDVVDGKEKILLLAHSPHPDIKVLKRIIENNPLFEVKIKILSSDELNSEDENFDILILHQLPAVNNSQANLVARLLSKLKPTLFVLGAQSNITAFNGMQEVLGINAQASKTDKVTALVNNDFKRFNFLETDTDFLQKLPPISAPFGEYRSSPGTQVILFQKVGNTSTERPLLAINTTVNRKSAVLTAEGLWSWSLEEYSLKDSQLFIEELIQKTLQLISLKEDKQKLKVYPVNTEFDVNENVILQSEAYNDLYQKIYDVEINLEVKNELGKAVNYNYILTQANSQYQLAKLPAGIYNYSAQGVVLGKQESTSGQFVVREKDLEFLNTTANFDFLRTLTTNHGGQFFGIANIDNWIEYQKRRQLPSKIVNNEDLRELINLKWLLILLLFLVTLEWVLRKYSGTY